jgi:hypothetical protein
MDMDGVLVHEEQAIPGADRFLARLTELGLPFLVLIVPAQLLFVVHAINLDNACAVKSTMGTTRA